MIDCNGCGSENVRHCEDRTYDGYCHITYKCRDCNTFFERVEPADE